MFEKIKKWYKQGLWTKLMVDAAAEKEVITKKQAQKIILEVNADER